MSFSKVDTFSEFLDSNSGSDSNTLLLIDIDGVLSLLREFHVEGAITDIVKDALKNQFLKARSNNVSEALQLLWRVLGENSPEVISDFTNAVNRAIEKAVKDEVKKPQPTELSQADRDNIAFDFICKRLAFGLAMETSPACELELPVLPGNRAELNTLASDLHRFLVDNPNVYPFFLTSRPVGAAKNIVHILQELCKSSGLGQDVLLELMISRNHEIAFDSKKAQVSIPNELFVVGEGTCIAAGRNRKSQLIEALCQQLQGTDKKVERIVFIDDKESYVTEVAGLAKEGGPSVSVSQLQIPNAKAVGKLVIEDPILNRRVSMAIRNAIQKYPLYVSKGIEHTSSRDWALAACMAMGIAASPDDHLAGEAAMAEGKRKLAEIFTGKIPPLSSHGLFQSATHESPVFAAVVPGHSPTSP